MAKVRHPYLYVITRLTDLKSKEEKRRPKAKTKRRWRNISGAVDILENTSQILLGLISAILKKNFYRYLSRIMSIQRKQRHEDEGSMSNVPHIPSDNQGS
jgi:hypothetical protein